MEESPLCLPAKLFHTHSQCTPEGVLIREHFDYVFCETLINFPMAGYCGWHMRVSGF